MFYHEPGLLVLFKTCTVSLSSYRNTTESLRERETVTPRIVFSADECFHSHCVSIKQLDYRLEISI